MYKRTSATKRLDHVATVRATIENDAPWTQHRQNALQQALGMRMSDIACRSALVFAPFLPGEFFRIAHCHRPAHDTKTTATLALPARKMPILVLPEDCSFDLT